MERAHYSLRIIQLMEKYKGKSLTEYWPSSLQYRYFWCPYPEHKKNDPEEYKMEEID